MKKQERLFRLGLLMALLVSGRGLAEPPRLPATPEPVTTLPWVKDVPIDNQDLAYASFRTGNLALKDSRFVQAVQAYREALTRWNHPAIHYNLALALMQLDQPIEVYDHLDSAMRYGPSPLERERYEYARSYKYLLDQQLVTLRIDCQKEGAIVTLDGKTVFVAPGHYEARVRPGTHVFNAIHEGFLPSYQSRTLMPGEKVSLDIKLYTVEDVTRSRRRWAVWMPWAVVGGGLALAAGGGLLQLQTQEAYRLFDGGITSCGGCKVAGNVATARTMGDHLRLGSWGAYAVGGGALLGGALLLYLNQPQLYRINPETGREVEITPLLGSTTGLQASGSF